MPRIALVTIGTDGFVDYIQTPDGAKFNLGPVSVLKLITGLVPIHTARAALKEFIENKQVMLSVNLDKMWSLLPFQRARYSSFANSFIKKESSTSSFPPLERNMLKASFETFTANMDMAEDIINKVQATDETIDRLIAAGKKFDSVRAKTDLHRIASQVTEIAQTVDLAHPWVATDLTELSKKANEIHGLFEAANKE